MARDPFAPMRAHAQKMKEQGLTMISEGQRMTSDGQAMVDTAKAILAQLPKVQPDRSKTAPLTASEKLTAKTRSEHAKNYGRWNKMAIETLEKAPEKMGTVDGLTEIAMNHKIMPGKPRLFIKKKLTSALHTMSRLKDPQVVVIPGPRGQKQFQLAQKLLNP